MKKYIFPLFLLLVAVTACNRSASELFVSPTEIEFTADGQPVTPADPDPGERFDVFIIESNESWNAVPNNEWYKVEPGFGSGNGTVTVIVEPNPDFEPRDGTISITANNASGTVTVKQYEKPYTISLSPLFVEFDQEGIGRNGNSFTIRSNYSWYINFENADDMRWVSIDKDMGTEDGEIAVSVKPNETDYEVRVCNLQITVGTTTGTMFIKQGNVFDSIEDAVFLEYCRRFDTDGNGVLTFYEAAAATEFNLNGMGINSLAGIEHFSGLQQLSCTGNSVSSLDLSKNTELRSLICNNSNIADLDISGCEKLNNLVCNANPRLSIIYVWDDFNLITPGNSIANITKDETTRFAYRQ